MRHKDWADEDASPFYDILAESDGDDQKVVDLIAEALREAFLTGLAHKQVGLTKNSSKGGDVSTYICTARRNPSQTERVQANQVLRPSQLETETAVGYKLTWDGVKSVKKGKADGD